MQKEKREKSNETREELPSGKKGSINRCGNVKYGDTWVEPKRGIINTSARIYLKVNPHGLV